MCRTTQEGSGRGYRQARSSELRRAREGKIIAGHTPPYGFVYNEGRDNLVPEEGQMRVAQRILRELAGGASVFGISQTLMREGVPAPRAGANWNRAAIRRITLSDLYVRHTAAELRGMVSAEVAARLDPDTEYGVWHFNTKRTTRSHVSRVGPNGKEYAERQRTRAKPKEEWIAVPVPLGEGHGVPRATVEAARETMRSRARHYRETSRVWELAGGVYYCVHCERRRSFANVKRKNGKRMAYYRCQGHRRNGHKEGCPNARHYRAVETEDLVWRFVRGLLTDPDRLRRGLDAMIEEKRRGLRGDPDREARLWLERIADADRQRARAQDLAIEGLLSPEELRSKLSALEGTREAAARELEALKGHREKAEKLERDRDALLAGYAALVPRGLDAFEPEDRRWTYGRIRLKVFGHSDGTIVATWAFGVDASVISEYAHEDEGNAYLRLGEVLTKLGREDEAREAYGTGIGQAEKFGHSGMAEDLRLAQVQLGG